MKSTLVGGILLAASVAFLVVPTVLNIRSSHAREGPGRAENTIRFEKGPSSRSQSGLTEEMRREIRACAPNVAESTMLALTRVESAWRPYVININRPPAHLSRQPSSKDEAVAVARELLRRGYNFDAGYAQINSVHLNTPILFRAGVREVSDLFDSCKNVRAGEAILVDCYRRAQRTRQTEDAALYAALSCYNTGSFTRGFSNGYVHRVYRARVK